MAEVVDDWFSEFNDLPATITYFLVNLVQLSLFCRSAVEQPPHQDVSNASRVRWTRRVMARPSSYRPEDKRLLMQISDKSKSKSSWVELKGFKVSVISFVSTHNWFASTYHDRLDERLRSIHFKLAERKSHEILMTGSSNEHRNNWALLLLLYCCGNVLVEKAERY